MRIDHVEARVISDTRGKPTVEVVLFSDTFTTTASVPSGKSTGSYEAVELRDADGGVIKAIANVNGEISDAIVGRNFDALDKLDEFLIELDGTPDKSRLGANAILAVSIASVRLFAKLQKIPLWKAISDHAGIAPSMPHLFVNMINGGAHAGFNLPFQEHLLVLGGNASTAIASAKDAFTKLGGLLPKVPMGDEGGYAPSFNTLERPFELLAEIAETMPGVSIAVDAAATELVNSVGGYTLLGKDYSPDELLEIYRELVKRYSLHSIEDPFAETAGTDFARLTSDVGNSVLIIGDDLTVTNQERIRDAADQKEINAVLIKPNQIGTVSEAIKAAQATYSAGFKAVCSHRSGETMDTFISDFAYGIGAHGLKAGGLSQPERTTKYERLIAIEREATAANINVSS